MYKPPMTGNGKHSTYKNGEIGDGLLLFYQHYPKTGHELLTCKY